MQVEDVGREYSNLRVSKRGYTGPIQTHPLLFSRISGGLCVTEVGDPPKVFVPGFLTAMLPSAPIMLVLVLLADLAFVFSALTATVVLVITRVVH